MTGNPAALYCLRRISASLEKRLRTDLSVGDEWHASLLGAHAEVSRLYEEKRSEMERFVNQEEKEECP